MTNDRARGIVAFVVSLVAGAACLPACTSATEVDAASCTNGARDDGEIGIDCGGVCPAQCTGSGCVADTECSSGKCENAACAAPAGKVCGVGAPVPTCDDGQGCELDKDCKSGFCDAAKCATPPAESHSDGKVNAGETDVDCGGSVKATKPCVDGQKCIDSGDCVGTCTSGICGPIGPTDGKKNNGETDVDCGGPNAPKCANGKDCGGNADCLDDYCPDATKKCTAPRYDDGVKNGDETDLDCGGTGPGMKKCAQGLACLVDGDCFGACAYTKKCVDVPSCKNHFGGDTCGTNEIGSAVESHLGPAGVVMAGHEDCCRTLPVAGYSDPNAPGKTVYVDKYEITAGRMRAFLEAIGGGVDAAGNAKDPNVKAWMAAHRPARWNVGWENVLPGNNTSSKATYVVQNATVDMLYPGQDQYLVNKRTQSTWWIRATGPNDTAVQQPGQQGTYTVDTGVFFTLQTGTMFPEYYANPAVWTGAGEGEGYAVNHALNCSNAAGAYGWATYWFDQATVAQYGGGVGKAYGKDILDQKALNCTPNALFAAFCAWDGGQLATGEVMDNITGNTASPIFDPGSQNGKLAPGNSNCAGNTLNTFSDGTQGCYSVYYYPGLANNYDDSSKIASPGRVIADAISKSAADEPWMDMIGNLQEAVLKRGETLRFDFRGYGVEYGSISHHRNQQTTPRNKGGAFGARCMRFK